MIDVPSPPSAASPSHHAFTFTLDAVDVTRVERLGAVLAAKMTRGDVILLRGDLGAGKSTLARAIIRAALADPHAEVPSPTFTLVQSYETARFAIAHADLYRVSNPREVDELGLDEASSQGVLIAEWPERDEARWPSDRLEVALDEVRGSPELRRVTVSGQGTLVGLAERLSAILAFVTDDPVCRRVIPPDAAFRFLQGDASPRAYVRIVPPAVGADTAAAAAAILMDAPRQPDGPPVRNGLPYSRLAHLAEDVAPFVAVQRFLLDQGLSVPQIHAMDLDAGLLLIEDLGDDVYGRLVAGGGDQRALWLAALEPLVALARMPVPGLLPVVAGRSHPLADYDRQALGIESELLLDWAFPLLLQREASTDERDAFGRLWDRQFDTLAELTGPAPSLVLRDYHSPNLLELPGRTGARAVGIIDFQDAVRGHPAYDLASLTMDARLDVPEPLRAELVDHYCALRRREDARFDDGGLRRAHAILGAQRNTKILGIFARLAVRDRKPGYLVHMARIARYLQAVLLHPDLGALAAWYRASVLAADIHFEPAALAARADAAIRARMEPRAHP